MSIEEIRAALEAANRGLPEAALRAAVTQSDALAPIVAALLKRATEGEALLLAEENLIFFGVHAMAAARATSVCPAFVALLRGPEIALTRVFGDDWSDLVGPILMSVYDGNDVALRDLVLHTEAPGQARGLVIDALARLVRDGRSDRQSMMDLLDRFERDVPPEPGDLAWLDWQEAILALRLTDFTDRVRRGWTLDRAPYWREVDQEDWLQLIQTPLEAQPASIDDRLTPIDDPIEALRFLRVDDESNPGSLSDTSPAERDWLDWILLRGSISGKAMSLEQADGYFTALLCAPQPAGYSVDLWSDEPIETIFPRPELREEVCRLMERHFRSIAERLENEIEPEPFLEDGLSDSAGSLWALGFIQAAERNQAAWAPLSADKHGARKLLLIASLGIDPNEVSGQAVKPEQRSAVLDQLPELVMGIRRSWRSPRLSGGAPEQRAPKIGRNDPCPCGSGKKFKKCCGAVGTVRAESGIA